MSTQRLTVSLPAYLHEQLINLVPERKRSEFVARALEKKIIEEKEEKKIKQQNPLDAFLEWRKKYPIRLNNRQILAAIKKGRK